MNGPSQYHSKYHNVENNKTMAVYFGIIKYKNNPPEMAKYIEKHKKYFPNVSTKDLQELNRVLPR